MKPIVGIVPSINEEEGLYFVHEDNIAAIEQGGGVPVVIPFQKEAASLVSLIDGLYLTGGFDIDPTLFGEEPHPNLGEINRVRDIFEIDIIKKVIKMNKPILAVCRGCQILNIAMEGDMYQDIYSQITSPLLQHQQKAVKNHASHFVEVVKGSLLYKLVQKQKIKVNSRHHQANRHAGKNIVISGVASDGVIEAIESQTAQFLLGLQWHPENMAVAGDETSKAVYRGFIDACKIGKDDPNGNH